MLETDLAESPVKGRPLAQRPRNFRPDADAAVRALGGPTLLDAHGCARSRTPSQQHEQQLDEAWRELAAQVDDEAAFARAWRKTARRWNFAEVNELIERHNRYFPAEAKLPMDPRTKRLRADQRPPVSSGSRWTRSGSWRGGPLIESRNREVAVAAFGAGDTPRPHRLMAAPRAQAGDLPVADRDLTRSADPRRPPP